LNERLSASQDFHAFRAADVVLLLECSGFGVGQRAEHVRLGDLFNVGRAAGIGGGPTRGVANDRRDFNQK
jgi:hypothetical protein